MKTTLLILTTFFLFTGCDKEGQNQDMITENATVYYQWVDIGFADARCTYVLKINNIYYCTDNLKLSHKSEKNPIKVNVKYEVTNNEAICTSKVFNETKNLEVIEIISIEEL